MSYPVVDVVNEREGWREREGEGRGLGVWRERVEPGVGLVDSK